MCPDVPQYTNASKHISRSALGGLHRVHWALSVNPDYSPRIIHEAWALESVETVIRVSDAMKRSLWFSSLG